MAHSQPIETYARAPHNRLRNAWPILLFVLVDPFYTLLLCIHQPTCNSFQSKLSVHQSTYNCPLVNYDPRSLMTGGVLASVVNTGIDLSKILGASKILGETRGGCVLDCQVRGPRLKQ